MPGHDTLFIGGEWVSPSSAARIAVRNASTEEPIGETPEAAEADVDAAVAAARRAFDDPSGWSRWEPARRGEALERLAAELEQRAQDIGRLVSQQNGMPFALSPLIEGMTPVGTLRYMVSLLAGSPVEEETARFLGGDLIIRHEPIGVVAGIVPWNYPQTLSSFKYAPALAAGNTIVLKPSPETVLDSYVFAEAVLAAGLPPGVVNIVPGGREIGAYLVQHRDVDKVAFTGSTAAGRQIAEVCGRLLRPVSLELGGKSAAIILDDADLDLAKIGQDLFAATLVNNGQTCYAGTRILAPRSRYGEVVDTLAGFASSLPVGDALDPATLIGPLVSERQRDRVERYIAKGKSDGARLVTGGGQPAGLDTGLVRRADDLRRRGQQLHDRAGGDLRPGAVGHRVRGHRRRHQDRQRLRLRPGRVGVDHRSGPRQGRHPAGAHRHHGHQRLPAGPGRPVGRRQVQRHRP